ncbi:MAG: hypothetical protein NTY74_04770 [Ignavibacteriae bacterium]|nr:hypothetical protein [Ignavibacteriota bacterium]
MNKNLFNLLSKFSKNEWNEFGDFLSSPYFVKGRDYSELYDFLKKYFQKPGYAPEISNDAVLKKIKNTLSNQTLENRFSELNKLAEKFLTLKNLESNQINYFSLLYEELSKRDLFVNFHTSFLGNKDKLIPVSSADFIPYSKIIQAEGFYQRYKMDFQGTYNQFCRQADCLTAFSLDRLLYFATEFYFADMYGTKYEAKRTKKVLSNIDFDSFFKLVTPADSEFYRSVLLRYHVYNSIVNPDNHGLIDVAEEYFENTKTGISLDVKIDYFQKMQANFVHHINKGEQGFLNKLFDLMNARLDDGETINFGLLDYPSSEFRDIVVIGLRVEEFDWVENFIGKYSALLPEAFMEEEKTLAHLKLYFAKKDFLRVLLIIRKQKPSKKHVHNIDVYKYKLMTNYELNYSDDLKLTIDNLNYYLKKEGIVEIQKKGTLIFIQFLIRLMKLKSGTSDETPDSFVSSLTKETEPLPEKRWFLEKAAEL